MNKSLGISSGFHDPKMWVDTGNYALNMMISNDFKKGVPLGKVTVFAGESGSGKSFIASGNLIRSCQQQGVYVVLMDSEYALDETWLANLGVDTSDDKITRYSVSLVDDCAKIVSNFMEIYLAEYANLPEEDQPPVMFVMDSLGMLSTPTEEKQFNDGEMKGDMGRKAKQLKAFVTQCLKMFGPYKIGLVATNHVYKSQDQFNPDDVISGGSGFIFASSIIVSMQKLKLKMDEDGNKTTEVRGIRSKIKCVKSRFSKPFEEVEIQIPYDTGMSPYSGLFEMFLNKGMLTKDGNRYKFKDKTGKEHKLFRKEYEAEHYELLMDAFADADEEGLSVGLELEGLEEE